MWNPAGRVYELLRAQRTESEVWELCSILMNQRPLCHSSEKTRVVWESTRYFHIRSIWAKSSGMQLNCAYFLPHSKANFCPLLDQNIKLIGNVLLLCTLWTFTLVAHLFNTQRTDPLFCLALVTFKDSHSAWERTDINNYRIKCCQRIMFSGCFGPMKAKATIKLSEKRAIINSTRITLYHTALLLWWQNKLKYLSLSVYRFTYIPNFFPFKNYLGKLNVSFHKYEFYRSHFGV